MGKDASKHAEMERVHHCTIAFPSRASKSSDVRIETSTRASLLDAYHTLQRETEKARNNLPPTHFINLPLGFDSHFVETMSEFREHILQHYSTLRGMDKSLLVQPTRMHLTLLTLKCFSDADEELAQRVLEDSLPHISSLISVQPLTLNLAGLNVMNDNPSQCHVLYIDIIDDDIKRKVLQLAGLFHLSFPSSTASFSLPFLLTLSPSHLSPSSSTPSPLSLPPPLFLLSLSPPPPLPLL